MVSFNTDKLLWGTDFHTTKIPTIHSERFFDGIRSNLSRFDRPILAISGDLGKTDDQNEPFVLLEKNLAGTDTTVIFVRGNHDLKPSDLDASNRYIQSNNGFIDLHEKLIKLNNRTCIIGHNGAPDYRSAGIDINLNITDKNASLISFPEALNNLTQIDGTTAYGVARLLQLKADQSTKFIISKLIEAFDTYDLVYVMTHYPPFVEACRYQDQIALPKVCGGIVNYQLGKKLTELMSSSTYKDKFVQILCGHTHEDCVYQPLPNLTVNVGRGLRLNQHSPHDLEQLPIVQSVLF